MAYKLKELKRVIVDTIVIYKEYNGDYKDLYKGDILNAPQNLLEEEVRFIAAKRKGIIDIEIYGRKRTRIILKDI